MLCHSQKENESGFWKDSHLKDDTMLHTEQKNYLNASYQNTILKVLHHILILLNTLVDYTMHCDLT